MTFVIASERSERGNLYKKNKTKKRKEMDCFDFVKSHNDKKEPTP